MFSAILLFSIINVWLTTTINAVCFIYSVETTYGIKSVISKLMKFVEIAET
jgi:hypothetical protein